MAGSSPKFIARTRAPRVQIEYDVELYGAENMVQLPFVMGVMSDLAGKSETLITERALEKTDHVVRENEERMVARVSDIEIYYLKLQMAAPA